MSDGVKSSSTPNLAEFDPRQMPWQYRLIWDVRRGFDYSLGTHEVLVSGTVGSGKSLPIAHLAVTHCLENPGANFGIGRRVLKDLKDTFCRKIHEHLAGIPIKYEYNKTSGDFLFPNGSRISAFSWADGNYKKFGSYELSSAAIEEAQENKDDHAAQYILSRIGRLPHVKENVCYFLVNPDSPGHWIAKRFQVGNGKPAGTIDHVSPLRHAYYSKTEDNRNLSAAYIRGLRENMDAKLAMRLLDGAWIEIDRERIYSSYTSERNYRPHEVYKVDERYPVHVSFDFNIAAGKPLSTVFFQHIGGVFHFFAEVIVEGLNTADNLSEGAHRGLYNYRSKYIVHGDAAGKHGDTRGNRSDYEIIRKFLGNHTRPDGTHLEFETQVPQSNPPVRDRHNIVNIQCANGNGEIRVQLYKGCAVMDEGMRLTSLKKGAEYVEDDSKHYQHCTTAMGYGIVSTLKNANRIAPTSLPRKI